MRLGWSVLPFVAGSLAVSDGGEWIAGLLTSKRGFDGTSKRTDEATVVASDGNERCGVSHSLGPGSGR